MKIRTYLEKDHPQIIELFNEFGDFFVDIDDLKFIIRADRYSKTMVDEMIKNTKDKGTILIAEEDEKILGFIAGNIRDLTPENTVENVPMRKGAILEFFVTKEYRKKGIGKELMKKIESYFMANNCNTINVEVFSPNRSAYNFYTSFGYKDRNIDMMKVIKSPLPQY